MISTIVPLISEQAAEHPIRSFLVLVLVTRRHRPRLVRSRRVGGGNRTGSRSVYIRGRRAGRTLWTPGTGLGRARCPGYGLPQRRTDGLEGRIDIGENRNRSIESDQMHRPPRGRPGCDHHQRG